MKIEVLWHCQKIRIDQTISSNLSKKKNFEHMHLGDICVAVAIDSMLIMHDTKSRGSIKLFLQKCW